MCFDAFDTNFERRSIGETLNFDKVLMKGSAGHKYALNCPNDFAIPPKKIVVCCLCEKASLRSEFSSVRPTLTARGIVVGVC
jgi:hypothetical protein